MEGRMTAQQLKNSILQMAVRGKLVPQDPNDEPASVLLERIRKEKEQLIKEGKIKRNKNESFIFRGSDNLHYEQIGKEVRCIEDELPFEIPESWEFCRLDAILYKLTDGTHKTPKYTESGIPFISVKDISSGSLDFSDTKYISRDDHNELYKRCNPEKNDILITKVGSNTGIPVIVDTTQEFSLFVSVALLKFNTSQFDIHFILNLLRSPLVQEQCKKNTRGVGNLNWVIRDISNTLIVIPPYNEQQRITEALNKIHNLIHKYEKIENQLHHLNSTIKEKLKKSILQYAIEGKLVEQDPNDEPVSVLLNRIHDEKEKLIKEGKIKRNKNESIIYRRDNSYYEKQGDIEISIEELYGYDIPENWYLCKISDICVIYTGNSINQSDKSKYFSNIEYGRNYIATKDLDFNHTFNYNNGIKIPESFTKFKTAKKGSTLMCIEGGSAGKKIGLLEELVCFGNKLCCFDPILIDSKYMYFYLQSEQFLKQFNNKMSGIIGGVSIKQMESIYVPIPPLQEQERISKLLDQITNT